MLSSPAVYADSLFREEGFARLLEATRSSSSLKLTSSLAALPLQQLARAMPALTAPLAALPLSAAARFWVRPLVHPSGFDLTLLPLRLP